jgi:dihydrolipoamide dehydrogenase
VQKYHVAVIGGGPGGYVAALRAAQLGLNVVLVEKDSMGGTCLNRGCIPTKALVKSAELWREMNHAETFGLSAQGLSFDYTQVMARKNQVVATLVGGIDQLMKSKKITVVRGFAELSQPGKVTVNLPGEEKLEILADNVIIATGSEPSRPPIPGRDLPGVVTSDEALEDGKFPARVVVIGGGVIGMEFASIYASFGAKVTVVEMLPAILPNVDEELPKRAAPTFKKLGMEIVTKATVKEIKRQGEELQVVIEDAKGVREVVCDQVLLSAGRRPVLSGIDIEKLNLRVEKGALVVNTKLETGVPGVYAIGDAVGGIMLAHVASAEGIVAAENCAGLDSSIDYRVVPNCIFTYPEIAGVGITEQEAKAQGLAVKVSKFPFTGNGKALAIGENLGTVKLISKEDGILVGAHILGPHASDLIHELALAVEKGLTGEDIAHTIHAHPTLSEAVMEAAHGLIGKPLHLA